MNLFNKLNEKKYNIVITSHRSPDGDAIGSSLALSHYLKSKGHQVQVIVPDSYPNFLNWLSGASDILTFEKNQEEVEKLIRNADLLFCLDYNEPSRVGDMQESVVNSNAIKVMIDHHLNPSDFCDYTISDTKSCSTAQLVYEFIEDAGDLDTINETIGEGIYCGIVTDSGSFRFPSVTPKTHLIAADLIQRGLNHSRIHENLFDVNTLNKLHLLGYALNEKLRVLEDVPVAIIDLSLEEAERFDVKKGDTEGLVNYALSVEGVKMAAFIREDNNRVKMSFRSKGDIPVNEFSSKYFSGGGHKNAAGGMCEQPLKDVLTLFEKNIRVFFNELENK